MVFLVLEISLHLYLGRFRPLLCAFVLIIPTHRHCGRRNESVGERPQPVYTGYSRTSRTWLNRLAIRIICSLFWNLHVRLIKYGLKSLKRNFVLNLGRLSDGLQNTASVKSLKKNLSAALYMPKSSMRPPGITNAAMLPTFTETDSRSEQHSYWTMI